MSNFQDMKDHFKYRTGFHLWCLRKWSDRIADISDPRIDSILLNKERDEHDQGKWLEPEYTPYLYISWNYKCKREGVEFYLTEEMKDAMHNATYHHIKNHKHHPEFWDDNVTIEFLNKDNRDKPSNGKLVDATGMPLTYVASMCADWFAMSEELNSNPADWAKQNINIRWKFNQDQVDLIYYLIENVWSKHRQV